MNAKKRITNYITNSIFCVFSLHSDDLCTKDTTKGCKKWNMHSIQVYFIGVELPKKINKIIAVKNGKTYFSLVNTGVSICCGYPIFCENW